MTYNHLYIYKCVFIELKNVNCYSCSQLSKPLSNIIQFANCKFRYQGSPRVLWFIR